MKKKIYFFTFLLWMASCFILESASAMFIPHDDSSSSSYYNTVIGQPNGSVSYGYPYYGVTINPKYIVNDVAIFEVIWHPNCSNCNSDADITVTDMTTNQEFFTENFHANSFNAFAYQDLVMTGITTGHKYRIVFTEDAIGTFYFIGGEFGQGGGSGGSSTDYTTLLTNIQKKLAGDTDSLSTRLNTLNTTFTTYLGNINTTLSNLGTKMDTTNEKLDDINNTLDSKLDQLNDTFQDINDTLNNKLSGSPPVLSQIVGYNYAVTTSTPSFKMVLDYQNATDYQIKLDRGSWETWTPMSTYTSQGYLQLSNIATSGMHIGYVRLRNGAGGKMTEGRMIFYKE